MTREDRSSNHGTDPQSSRIGKERPCKLANYDPADAVARLKTAGLAPKRRGGRVYFDDPDGIECQVAGA